MLVSFLSVLAVLSVVLGLAGGLAVLAVKTANGQIAPTPTTVLWMIIPFAGSCCLAGVLWALAWLCRRHYLHAQAEQRMVSILERLAAKTQSRPAHPGEQAEAGLPVASPANREDAIFEQLRELNVNLLLSEAQRQIKRQYLTERKTQRLTGQLEEAISAGDFPEAERLLDRLFRFAPDLPELPALRSRIEQARNEAQARDAAEAGRQAEDLMASGDFAQAQTVAEALLGKYPASSQAAGLIAKVRRERETFVTEQRLQMYRKVEKEASARHWHSALAAARELLDAYPNSTEADAVRAQLPTITDNARIEEVRHLRDEIADLIARRRFGEAVEIARDVIERFPQTAAAEELRRQMSRLEELAESSSEDAKT